VPTGCLPGSPCAVLQAVIPIVLTSVP